MPYCKLTGISRTFCAVKTNYTEMGCIIAALLFVATTPKTSDEVFIAFSRCLSKEILDEVWACKLSTRTRKLKVHSNENINCAITDLQLSVKMLCSYRNILIGLGVVSSVLCDDSQDHYHGISIYDSDPTREQLGREPLRISSSTTTHAATNSLTENAISTPSMYIPDISELFNDLDDEKLMSPSTLPFPAPQKPSNSTTASMFSPLFTTASIASFASQPDPIKAALDWLTSTANSTSSNGKSMTSTSSTESMSSSHTTTTSMTNTEPAKAALDWLTSGLGDKSPTPATTTDSEHSSIVSGILSGLEATHTSAAAANRLSLGFW